MDTASGTFDVTMAPGAAELAGQLGRFEIDKTFHGDVEATGTGVMLTAGDPAAGAAGYVAMEVVSGQIHGKSGTFALQQFGQMNAAGSEMRYEIVNGSGTGDFLGVHGVLELTAEDGIHHYELNYELPAS